MKRFIEKISLMKHKFKIQPTRFSLSINLILLLAIQLTPVKLNAIEEDKKSNTKPTLEYLEKEIEYDYIIGPGDVLNIKLSPVLDELSNNYSVDGNGTIIMPNIKRIYVEGLTINELSEILNEKYKTFIKNVSTEIYIQKYRPIRVFVNGEVENSGVHTLLGSIDLGGNSIGFQKEKDSEQLLLDQLGNQFGMANYYGNQDQNNVPTLDPLEPNNFSTNDNSINKVTPNLNYFPTIFDGIRKAGGVTFYSDLTDVKITRANSISKGGGRIQANINFLDVITGKDPNKNIRIFDGDVITISKSNIPITGQLSSAVLSNLNPKLIKIFITGRVNNPGAYAVTRSSTLNDSLAVAGGTKILKGPVTFIRFNQDGGLDKRIFLIKRNSKRGSYKNPYLKSGDLIFIGNSPLNIAAEVMFEITKPFIGLNSLRDLFFD